MTEQKDYPVVGAILIKCDRGQEKWLRNRVRDARKGGRLCLIDAGENSGDHKGAGHGGSVGGEATQRQEQQRLAAQQMPTHEKEPPACRDVIVVDAGYCFGPFDFLLTIRATDAAQIEQFVVECLRSDRRIRDTQTLVGIAIDAPQG